MEIKKMNKVTKYAHDNKIKLTEVAEAFRRSYSTIKQWTKTKPNVVMELIDCLVRDRENK